MHDICKYCNRFKYQKNCSNINVASKRAKEGDRACFAALSENGFFLLEKNELKIISQQLNSSHP